jgi:Protein of unknown function (DUF3987)
MVYGAVLHDQNAIHSREVGLSVKEFIERVLGSASGNAFVSRASGKTANGKLNINIHKTFLYPQQLEEMITYAEQHAKEDVYLSPLLYGDKRNDKGNIARTPENALTSQTIYMDSDLCPPEKFRLMPSIHVVTSKGRGHDYWVLDKPVDAKRAAEIAHKITTAHREDGCDPSGWSANKVLRLPNTVNTGHGFPESVLAEISGTVYTIEEMENAYEHIDVYERPIMGRVTDAVEIVEPSDLPDYTDALNKVPADVLELALQEPILGPEGNRSEMRYRLLCELFRLGDLITDDEALTIAWNAPASRKWSLEDPRGFNGLLAEANKAWLDVQWETGMTQEPPEESSTAKSAVSLLTDDERSMSNGYPCWVDRYVGWCENKLAKQNPPYDRMNAWVVLSAAFSDVAFIPRKNGPEGLNLYTMTLGETTSGKSQSLKLMRTVMDEVFVDDRGYNLGGNASPNALGEKLQERDGKVSLFSKDEAHGLFKQWATQDWTSGMMEDLALLYDGIVPPMLRVGKKDIEKASKTHFLMHLMGTPEEITRSLNRDMFKSGFLARFMWQIGEPRTLTKDAVREEDSDGTEIKLGFEPMARQWSAEFADVKRKLRGGTPNGYIPIRISKQGADRMSKVKWDMVNLVKKSDQNWDIINPSLVRMGITIRKCASLLALSEGLGEADVKHVVKAIQYAEEWIKNLFIIAEQISASDFERNCDLVEQFVKERDNKVKLEFVNRRFKAWRVRDLQESINALVSQGRIRELSGKEGKWLELNR